MSNTTPARELVTQNIRETIFKDQDSGSYFIPRDALIQMSSRDSDLFMKIVREEAAARKLDLWTEDDFINKGFRISWAPGRRNNV